MKTRQVGKTTTRGGKKKELKDTQNKDARLCLPVEDRL